ncbi:hypothetical protein BX661DRAFT_180236 [Kickxella alabastrina]|uniref:uncharacterized protein n=1 Tax=Kickxella alabastrina TaxID=61397 RepID=UPI00221FF606|nr:uncharacterized protein BX661DRAFT_191362 [Kickxella alabastrina]XP_051392718.1 uncharacterized protein BX661DRAFT_180236 [Kickxella alabastrina]KAI7818617.1 hypothetical protein BX661DRAFT_191362 [Kickxella alabastrina]KAI7830881.1 hypothetical protein BX661DRAFT_180236 [Kickxella alabastrina]
MSPMRMHLFGNHIALLLLLITFCLVGRSQAIRNYLPMPSPEDSSEQSANTIRDTASFATDYQRQPQNQQGNIYTLRVQTAAYRLVKRINTKSGEFNVSIPVG